MKMFFRSVLVLATSLTALTSPVSVREDIDWKYSLGWDGVVSPASAFGAPTITNDINNGTALEKRTVGGIFICSDINWGGTCGYAVQPINTCITLGSDWNNIISSIGPDPGTAVTLYGNAGCHPDIFGTPTVVFPGYANLNDVGFNDQASSFFVAAS